MVDEAVPEDRLGTKRDAAIAEQSPRGIKCDSPKRDDHFRSSQRCRFRDQMRMAGRNLAWSWLVLRRCAPHGREDVRIVQLQSVGRMPGGCDVREPCLVHRVHEKVAGSIPGEDATGAIGAVGGGRQPEDEDPRERIAESRNRPAPVGIAAVRGFLVSRDLFAVGAEPHTTVAADDVSSDHRQGR